MPSSKRKHLPSKQRLDLILVERGLAETRQRAQALIMAGQVRVNGQPAKKSGEMVARNAQTEIFGEGRKYASRAGRKLEGALEDFQVKAEDCVCLDVGASNGGFTDCLLQHGARRVYAVDVNTKQLDWKLQRDARVLRIEKNARYLRPEDIGEAADHDTADVSFNTETKIKEAAVPHAKPGATLLIHIKPEFELDRSRVGKGGIVRDAELHAKAIETVRAAADRAGLRVLGVKPSRITGAEGNQEFFLHACRAG